MNLKKKKYQLIKKIYWDKQVDDFYQKFQKSHPGYASKNKFKTLQYIARLNSASHRQRALSNVPLPSNEKDFRKTARTNFKYYEPKEKRCSAQKLTEKLSQYDIISFDIFDTAIYRKVEFPNDVFVIMASEIGHNDFVSIRKNAESTARDIKFRESGTREIVLSDIYNILEERYGIGKKWAEREIELELELSVPNPYILQVYNALKKSGKTIIFTSDMYLPKHAIEKMLEKNGYKGYHHFYLSNECALRKGDGTLQQQLIKDFPKKKIIHIGDAIGGDYEKSLEAGIDAVYNPDSKMQEREPNMDNLAGSFYRSLVDNTINNGTWNENLHFEHGFRVGGILSAGFCDYINQIAAEKNVDKILFCARDCEILWKIYNEAFKKFNNEYIVISRYAIMGVTSERYLYDWANRYILRYANQCRSTKTIETVLIESGFSYLVNYLEEDNIDRFLFPSAIGRKVLERFIFHHFDVIKEHTESSKNAAIAYYKQVLGSSKNILIVDIGWSGTCITALKYFIEQHFSDNIESISGALMCTSRGKALTNSTSDGSIQAYVYSPLQNMDLTRFMMPAKTPAKQQDLLHMPLEYMYTSASRSVVRYLENADGGIDFEYTSYEPSNKEEIHSMQAGMMYFVKQYREFTKPFSQYIDISPYVAFGPLMKAVQHPDYCYEVYRNFTYDALSAPFAENVTDKKFGELFDNITSAPTVVSADNAKKKILCITPELIYTGAPRSLLRICKVACSLDYEPVVWSAKPGPFINEFEANHIKVQIVPESDLQKKNVTDSLKDFEMAICNTIVTDKYAKLLSYHLPVVWYIREATNIMDFCRNNPERLFTLKHSKALCCVSDYAAKAIGQFTNNKIRVVHNSVEDETDMALPYTVGSDDKVKFVQFGTMEYRKGYDVLLAAYKLMPKEYQEKAELYFAGGFINSGSPYCSYLFSNMENEENVHYLGIVKGERKKIETLSQMDVVVVASRDESCSLVALEGAMLSKPLIVTENVGAKYMVGNDNGIITKTGDADSLKASMMHMIDHKNQLAAMGTASRAYYEKYASMESYTEAVKQLIELGQSKNTLEFKCKVQQVKFLNSSFYQKVSAFFEKQKTKGMRNEKVIVSLTTHPGRIKTVHTCIESLLNQRCKPEKVLLWLSKEQFPNMENGLPKKLLTLTKNNQFEIHWTDDDLKPHKKYFYAMQEYPDLPLIIVDDDVVYDEMLVGKLMNSYRKYPHSISCMRANLMMFKPDGTFRPYENWIMDYKMLLDTPSYQLLPTGVGGVLYPPKSLPDIAFNKRAIEETCLLCDDLWLNILTTHTGYNTVIPRDYCTYMTIEGSQEVALWRSNVRQNNNDVSLKNILSYYDEHIGDASKLIETIRTDRFSPIKK